MSTGCSTAPTLFDRADEIGLRVPTSCRRSGRCHECIVEVAEGAAALSPPTEAEAFLRPPYRLACQARVEDGSAPLCFTPLRRRLRILVADAGPAEPPTDPAVRLHGGDVLLDGRPLEASRGAAYGLAVDIGTTTVAVEIVDLARGSVVETVALENPQRFAGSDVMSRISYEEGGRPGELRQAVRRALNGELRDAYARHGIERRQVYEAVVVGNTTMRDLFFGLDVSPIGQRPYRSVTEDDLRAGRRSSTAITAVPSEVGLRMSPRGRVWSPPLVASHVGADVAAGLVAVGLDPDVEGPTMLVDVGTNTEVVLASGGRVLAASCPAGPAFEGGLVTHGMPAAEGAIESVRLQEDGTFAVDTVGRTAPAGICGSGLIDLVAELRRSGRMAPRGPFAGRATEIEVVPQAGITFSRADASALAQAKAATTVGQLALLRAAGVSPASVERLYLAGGFATYVDVRNAVEIGLLAPVPEDRVVKAGNAALRGAHALLLSRSARARLEALVSRVEHVELEQLPDFFDLFVDGCEFLPIPATIRRADDRLAV